MKRIIFTILLISIISLFIFVSFNPHNTDFAIADAKMPKAYILVEAKSGEVLDAHNENSKLPIASMVKIMTTLLVLEEIECGNLKMDEMIFISEKAGGMGGSQMFLDKNVKYSVSDLLKGIIVVSANDACVALAERISGSTEAFVDKMNSKAKSLGMNNTSFANCTGLPSEIEQGSSASDVAIMTRELMQKKIFFNYSKIWLENFTHPSGRVTEFTNTNKLVRFYDSCDGGKTGFTNEAMFCLSAQATKNNVKVIAVVIGSSSSKDRFAKVTSLFNYAFANYHSQVVVEGNKAIEEKFEIKKAKNSHVEIGLDKSLCVFNKRGSDNKPFEVIYNINDNLKAPIAKGECVGEAIIKINGEIVDKANLIALNDIEKAKYGDYIDKILGSW